MKKNIEFRAQIWGFWLAGENIKVFILFFCFFFSFVLVFLFLFWRVLAHGRGIFSGMRAGASFDHCRCHGLHVITKIIILRLNNEGIENSRENSRSVE